MDNALLKKLQKEEYEILCLIDDFCLQKGIKYSLYSGTMLGAVRHQGFIPWDDDIDLIMTRHEYTRFCEEWEKSPLAGYYLENYVTDSYTQNLHGKIRKNNTVFLSDIEDEKRGHHGIWIDIFVLDKVSKKGINRIKILNLGRLILLLIKGNGYFPGEPVRKRIARKVLKVIPGRKKIIKYIHQQLLINDRKTQEDYEWCDMCTLAHLNIFYPQETGKNYVKLLFCSRLFPVFDNYDEILRIIYGDYMTLPPIEKRVYTHYPKKVEL